MLEFKFATDVMPAAMDEWDEESDIEQPEEDTYYEPFEPPTQYSLTKAEKHAAALAMCGKVIWRWHPIRQTYETRRIHCRLRDCPRCESRRVQSENTNIAYAVKRNPGEIFQGTWQSVDEFTAWSKTHNLKAQDYRRYPSVDGAVVVFYHATAALEPQHNAVTLANVDDYDWRTICDSPYKDRDGKGINISGVLGKLPAKAKAPDAELLTGRDIVVYSATDENKQPDDVELQDISLKAIAAVMQTVAQPHTKEEFLAYADTIETTFMQEAWHAGWQVKVRTWKQTFSIDMHSLEQSFLTNQRKYGLECQKRGYLAKLPAYLT